MPRNETPVLEVGGSHVTAALVDPDHTAPVGTSVRTPLDSSGDADAIIATLLAAAAQLPTPPGRLWAVAFPGPFDYAAGVGRFSGVGKFDSLRDVDVRAALCSGLSTSPESLLFVNDADAFGLGVWAEGNHHDRLICLTLGTGVGSAFVADGAALHTGPGVPPDAEMHLTSWHDAPLEDTVSHRAIVRAYAAATGVTVPGVREVVERSRAGDDAATGTIAHAFGSLGSAMAPWVDAFGATQLAFGGSMAAAWDLLEPAIRRGLGEALLGPMPGLSATPDAERAALVGAAFAARHRSAEAVKTQGDG
jgi:glucokinase